MSWPAAPSAGGVTAATAAEIAALAAGDDLTAGGIYFDAASGIHYLASSTSAYAALSATNHLGTLTTAAILAYAAPVAGMTADSSDLDVVSGLPVRLIYNDSRWRLRDAVRMRLSGAGTTTTSAQYPTNTRFGPPAGAFALASRFDLDIKFAQSDEASTLASWRVKMGTAGTASDATIFAPSGTPMAATENQRCYRASFNIESATSILADCISNTQTIGWQTAAVSVVESGAQSLGGSDDTGDALYLGIDYTQGVSDTALVTTAILTLWP